MPRVSVLPVYLSPMPGDETQSVWLVKSRMDGWMDGLIDGNDMSATLEGQETSRQITTEE